MQVRALLVFFFQAEDGIRDDLVTGVQTCALPISVATMSKVQSGKGRRSAKAMPNSALVRERAFLRASAEISMAVFSEAVMAAKRKPSPHPISSTLPVETDSSSAANYWMNSGVLR